MITQAITAQGPVQIACGARDAKTARNGFILGGLLIFPVGFLCALLGIIGKVQFPEISATLALPKVVMALDPLPLAQRLRRCGQQTYLPPAQFFWAQVRCSAGYLQTLY